MDNVVILHLCLRDILPADVLLRARIDYHRVLDVPELDIDGDSLLKVSNSEDITTGLDILAENGISLLFASLEDSLHDIRVRHMIREDSQIILED